MSLPILTDWNGNNYNLIFVIINRLIKIVYYKSVKVNINALGLAEVIINVVMRYYGLSNSIVTNQRLLFTSKFWLLLYCFLSIKRRLFTIFYLLTDSQTKKQNSTIEIYLQAFVNFEQNNWARLFFMAEFAYNNAKNASTGYIPFNLNCRYHSCISYKKNLDSRSKSRIAKEFSSKLQKLMTIC